MSKKRNLENDLGHAVRMTRFELTEALRYWGRLAQELEVENARLREALEEISQPYMPEKGQAGQRGPACRGCYDVARQALSVNAGADFAERIMTKLTIPGRPVPKARHQVRLYRGGVITYTPAKTREFEKAVRVYALKQRIKKQEGDLAVIATFYTGGQGDVDNLLKSLLDGLNGVAWEDDRQVKAVLAVKRNCRRGEEKTEVTIMSEKQFKEQYGEGIA